MTNILLEGSGSLRIITLDRAEALNSLNGEMVKTLSETLGQIRDDPAAVAVLLKGAGNRAFCAGGDIKAARLGAMAIKQGKLKLEDVVSFFVEEYQLNRTLYHFEKPSISFMNGITMGGGVGIAGACRFRVATEKTVWAMPEVTIGFFPDVGAAYYLARAPHKVGRYLGLTGEHLSNAADLIKCGFATHYLSSDQIWQEDFERILSEPHATPEMTSLPYEEIESCFSANTVEEILENLRHAGSKWALETESLIRSKAPLSVKVALRHIQLAEKEDFDAVIERDLVLAGMFLRGDDLIEGVRAAVVDKDKSPKWNPATLEKVGIEQIEDYFNQNLGLVE